MDKTVGILGLGAMGTALAQAQLKACFETIVWNRTAEKARALASSGATVAKSAADLALNCDVILVCVDTCASAEVALVTAPHPGVLAGRTIVQLGTTTPAEARDRRQNKRRLSSFVRPRRRRGAGR
jgi:3-hydroxyisobutyrate dehydrogenase-like beta-hydroxyacid dehydrogenase